MKVLLQTLLYPILLTFAYQEQIQVVKIGAIFFHDESDLVDAFDMAIKDINDLELNVRLEPLKHFLRGDDSILLQELACDLIGNGAAAIFGPSSKATSDIVEIMCNITGIPHLQFDWHAQQTQMHRRNHQLTVNVAPLESVLATAFYDILHNKDFDWKSFTIVYERSANLARLQDLFIWKFLHKNGIKMQQFVRGDDYRVLWKFISNTREKFIMLDCPPDILVEVVNASIYFNMTGPFNNLFLSDLNTHTSGLDKLYSREFAASITAVRLRPFMPPPVHHEIDVFEEEAQEKLISTSTTHLYDAVVLYFNALRNIIQMLHYYEPHIQCGHGFWTPGVEIVAEMLKLKPKNVKPHYKTQKLQFNDLGERDDFNLEIYNPLTERISHIWNKNYQLVAFEKIMENSTLNEKKHRLEDKEDFSLKRVRFTVATRIGEPYVMWRQEPEGVHYEGNERFEGYAVDLIYKLAEECKFDFIFEPVPDNNYGGYDHLTDEWNGIIRQLMDNNAQIGICDLTITQARRTVVDFTVPFMHLGVSILYYKPPPPPRYLFAFLKPFYLDVWMYLLVAIMVIAIMMVFTARLSNTEWDRVSASGDQPALLENKWHLSTTFWLVISSIMCQGCDILPRGAPMRIFTAFWWIFALLLSQTYIAKLASFITSSKMEGSIRNLHDLVDQNKIQFGTVKGGSTSLFFSESNDSDYRVAWNKMSAMKPDAFTASNKEGVDRVKRSRGRYAFLMETTNLQYYVQRNCELTEIGVPFGAKHYGIAVPLNAPFRSNLSVGILKLSEKGVLYTLKNKWFNSNITDCTAEGNKNNADDIQFNMEAVGGLFVVLIAGVIVSVLIGVCEFLWNIEKISVKEQVTPAQVFKTEFMFFLRFWAKRKPVQCCKSQSNSKTNSTTSQATKERTSSTESEKKKKKTKRK